MSNVLFIAAGKAVGTRWRVPPLLQMLLAASLLAVVPSIQAQAPAAATQAAPQMSQADLDKLVGPIALYPDDLIAIILPASTFPLQIVQADRFLDKRKTNSSLPVDESWDDSVKSLLNYPDVVKKMSTDLDWTSDLGEAVVANQTAVMDAVQRFRRQVQSAGNLKTDEKQTVVVEQEVIKIVPTNPQVIYVPQYNPSTVVVYGGYSSYGYWPAPYPVYYYPYPPGAAFATGLIWGAAISAAWNGGHYVAHYGGGGGNVINIDRSNNINVGNGNVGNGNRGNGNRGGNSATQWKSDKRPGDVRSGANRNPGRVGDTPGAHDRGARPSQGAGAGVGGGQRGAQPSTADHGMNRGGANGAGAGNRGGGDAFGGYGSGRDARADSARGASSRQSAPSQRSAPSRSGGGGARAGGGGRGGRR